MPKILLLEDEKSFGRLYRRDLEGDGYSVVLAASDAGQGLLDEVSPDLVLYDVQEPAPDALDSLRRMLDHCPRVPVMLVVEQAMPADSLLCSTADAYVNRSRDTKPLRAQIRRLFAPEAV